MYVIVDVFGADPADAAVVTIVCDTYEPPVTSVPADVFDPVVDISRSFIGPVGAVYVAVPMDASIHRFASACTRLLATAQPSR